MTRDFSPLYKDAKCVICGFEMSLWCLTMSEMEVHAAPHLADGSACVQIRYDRTPPTEQVVATDSLPITGDWGGLWDGTGSADAEFKDTNSMAQRKALNELAATRRRIARAAKENR